MTSPPMRKLRSPVHCPSVASWTSRHELRVRVFCRHKSTAPGGHPLRQVPPRRYLAQVRPEPISEVWFTAASPRFGPADELLSPPPGNNADHRPPNERLLKLGKTLRALSPLLPDILTKPLPQELLSPDVSLHLFPSTHPHLPAVKGRVAYRAALWTSPVAWGCVPIVGNVKLKIVSEKIVRTGYAFPGHSDDQSTDASAEKLVVRWKTEPKQNNTGSGSSNLSASTATQTNEMSHGGINRGISKLLGGDKPIFNLNKGDDFAGLFIFTFDSEGRIASHTIEHADEDSGFDKTSKVVTLTDWLLGKARWGRAKEKEEELVPGLAMRVCREEWNVSRRLGHGHR
ncbi:hypothetical protein LTR99_005732 [Exophiala xenobiotica]|uniref:Chromosome transmission fidelity protein 4 n=1 Tax=Vermiconidia calcicola TaxID=1690605 RepID=A0AAV9QI84_9PEZI|nr:hypothetical protein LTR96_004849 [Exophiala xenobiotica]KAK5541194.1 hypothetical protein LTR25_002971 [Vermiconidia calcicola]KAK5549313.1 hypothetical protein LTR23_000421 [Chaetothyriales sp. CCFEE 6169]KAK5302775.1 hypothetical protein LTR99_005732 [Exophiala xenobiotica]KAK5340469.1 hypothetical protein LTR98_003591 [Exophiala xenobiotica]